MTIGATASRPLMRAQGSTEIQTVFLSVYWSKGFEALVAAAEARLLEAAERRRDAALPVALRRSLPVAGLDPEFNWVFHFVAHGTHSQ